MTKKAMLEASQMAMSKTESANTENTADAHGEAATHHRIAAEAAKLHDETAMHEQHKQMAVDHDMCASRCLAAAGNKVAGPQTGTPAAMASLASCSFKDKALKAANQLECDGNPTIHCSACSKDFKEKDAKERSAENVECPHCGVNVNVTTSKKENEEAMKQAEAGRKYHDKVNELVAKRLALSKPLEAGIAGEGYSLNDIQANVREAILDIAVLKAPPVGSTYPNYCGSPWVTDIVCPDSGDIWTAIVSGCDGKLYGVSFELDDDGEVTIDGDPEEVERTTDYEYVGEMDVEARKASGLKPLEASNAALKGAATKKSNEANSLTAEADDATNAANVVQDRETHADAVDKHNKAKLAHEDAITSHTKAESDAALIETHQAMVNKHTAASSAHQTKCEACESQRALVYKRHEELKASGANPSLGDVCHEVYRLDNQDLTEKQAGKLLSLKPMAIPTEIKAGGKKAPDAKVALDATGAQIDCGKADDLRSKLDKASDVIMFMPGGTHNITPSQGGKPVAVCVKIDETSAERMEAQRVALTDDKNKPFFSIQHSTQIAAFWPTKFFWDTRLDATGSLVSGVWAEGEWTKSGSQAVEGKDFRTFSPTFFVNEITNDPENPAEVVCNKNAKLNMGALENDPAFQLISPLWSKNAKPTGEKEIVRSIHDELKANRHTTLADVQSAVFKKHKLRLTEMQIAKHLAKQSAK